MMSWYMCTQVAPTSDRDSAVNSCRGRGAYSKQSMNSSFASHFASWESIWNVKVEDNVFMKDEINLVFKQIAVSADL